MRTTADLLVQAVGNRGRRGSRVRLRTTLGAAVLEVFGHSIPTHSQHSSTTIRAISSPNHSASSFMLTVNRRS